MTSLGDSGLAEGDSRIAPRIALHVVVVGVGFWLDIGRDLLGAFAESTVEEYVCGGDAVVGIGVFVDALCDVVEDIDELECVVGLGEDQVGEVERGVRWGLLGCSVVISSLCKEQ